MYFRRALGGKHNEVAARRHGQPVSASSASWRIRHGSANRWPSLGRPEAAAACGQATKFVAAIAVEPEYAFPRAFMAAAWTNVGDAYETMAARPGVPARPIAAASERRHSRTDRKKSGEVVST